jgi:putative acetyltransferase
LQIFLYLKGTKLINTVLRKLIAIKRPPGEGRGQLPGRGGFRYRGQEIQRIETFSDAVFAFAVTLLIVSLEVPRTFEDLLISMRGFVAFGICFCLLLLIWHEQHVFFRRYGLDDLPTIFLNAALLFIVLFYVYPLKFLFTLLFSDSIYGAGHSPFSIKETQIVDLMTIYGVGYIIIYVLFLLLYIHALRCKDQLQLNPLEIFDTRTKIYCQAILIGIGAFCTVLAHLLPTSIAGLSGMGYMLIPPTFWIYFSRRGRMRRKVITLVRTDSDDVAFVGLVRLLDADLAQRDGTDHSFYSQFNTIATLKHVVVAYADGVPIGCGAIKEYSPDSVEVKRMYTQPDSRGKGIASQVLAELERWAAQLDYGKCVLETGKRQPEAIALYQKRGYRVVPNYGQYVGVENSVCFEKELCVVPGD